MTNSSRNFFFKCGTNYIKAHLISRAISEQRRKPEKKSKMAILEGEGVYLKKNIKKPLFFLKKNFIYVRTISGKPPAVR